MEYIRTLLQEKVNCVGHIVFISRVSLALATEHTQTEQLERVNTNVNKTCDVFVHTLRSISLVYLATDERNRRGHNQVTIRALPP